MARGRPSKFTSEAAEEILKTIRAVGSIEQAAARIGVDERTIHAWLQRGAKQRSGPLRTFHQDYKKAIAAREIAAEAQIRKIGDGDWRAVSWWLSVSNPRRYAPKLRVHIQQEFSEAVARLKARYAATPEVLEEILSTIAGEAGVDSTLDDGDDNT